MIPRDEVGVLLQHDFMLAAEEIRSLFGVPHESPELLHELPIRDPSPIQEAAGAVALGSAVKPTYPISYGRVATTSRTMDFRLFSEMFSPFKKRISAQRTSPV